jgi:hypothetical protein
MGNSAHIWANEYSATDPMASDKTWFPNNIMSTDVQRERTVKSICGIGFLFHV